MGWIMRRLGRDALALQAVPSRSTYWEPKNLVHDPRRYFRTF